jgi:nicotinamidase-related amidase
MTMLRERGAAARSAPFLEWLDRWHDELPAVSLRDEIAARAGGPENVAVMGVDLLVGFCVEGPLASPRVGALGPKAARFLRRAREAGVREMLLAMDAHPEDSPEFRAFPPHCIRGTREAEPIAELRELPFYKELSAVYKGSLNVGLEGELGEWLRARPHLRAWIVIGDCTDLCVYQAAMHLRLQANARGQELDVWVPADLVDTYDLPVEAAAALGALPHDGELMHRLFLYHMALNGISVARSIAA